MKNKVIRIISIAFAWITMVCCTFTACSSNGGNGSIPGSSSESSSGNSSEENPPVEDTYPTEIFEADMYNPSKVGMTAEYLGTTERHLPEISNGGLERYPEYGVNFSATQEEKQAVLDENESLISSANTYDSMDKEGNLFLNGEPTGKKLYKHTAAAGMYEGDVSDDEPALIKKLTIKSRSGGNHITGLYAPAGEVIKLEMSETDFEKTGGLKVIIGQVLTNGAQNNIWMEKTFNRMPMIANTMTTKEMTSYVGSYLGGPIYVQPVKAGTSFTVTISGAVAYSHFILGYTNREEFEQNQNSSAPYFDLEVWDDSVRHSGPKSRAKDFDYDQLTEAAVLWDKISRVSNEVPAGSGGDLGITFLYDPFVAAGSMVAFVGRHTVNCPLYCMTAALDMQSAVDNASDAFWGCIHELNHHYQRFGFAPGDEVTNNAVSLVSYSLFTRISFNRELGNDNEGTYAAGWNRYTNPSWTLKQTLSADGTDSALDSYANLLYTFGQDLFIQATQAGGGRGGADVWYKAVSDVTHNDMTYYFKELLGQNVSENILSEYAEKDYPMFVPVSCIFQTGRSYYKDGKKYYNRTVQPYGIETGKDFVMDLNENIVLPEGFKYTIKNVSSPAYGTLKKQSEGVYVYTPDKVNRESGKIIVTLGIEKADGAFKVDDVDLVIEFRQKQATPTMLERTVYTYTPEKMYQSVEEAVENSYAGYETVVEEDNTNRVQNGNAEIWEPDPSGNAIMEIRGKFQITSDGKYRIALRGREYAGLYVSLDGKNYEKAALLENLSGKPDFDLSKESNYKDYQFTKGQWVYFKAVLLVRNARNFVGVGLGKFDGENVQINYLNAYRNSYYREEFESDYFYEREYNYGYVQKPQSSQKLVETNYRPWDDNYPIDNLFDENQSNFIHSDKTGISEENPFEITVDLGETINANRFTIYGEPSRGYQPKNFKLYGGTDLNKLELIKEVENAERKNNNITVEFEEQKLRYYKLVVTDTWAEGVKYIAYRSAEMSYELLGGDWYSPDDDMFVYRGNWNLSNKLSTFGHLYEGENATVEFRFTGSRFGIIAYESSEYGGFEVLIDGKNAEKVEPAGTDGAEKLVYLSERLSEGEHSITIRSKTKFNIDSFVLWRNE